jgi:ZIP family zinc transporter
MFQFLLRVIAYTLIPVAASGIGGVIAVIRPPGKTLKSAIQHFAAGVVFAAAALELIPKVREQPLLL